MKFRHFIIPLTIGIFGFVLASLLGPGWDYAFLNPYAYPIRFVPEYLGQIDQGGIACWIMNFVYLIIWNLIFFNSIK